MYWKKWDASVINFPAYPIVRLNAQWWWKNTFPLNISISMALEEIIAETSMPTIAHDHDFAWERTPLLINSIWDYIIMAVPLNLSSI